MKRIIAVLLLTLVTVLTFAGCESKNDASKSGALDPTEHYDFLVEIVAGIDCYVYMDKENLCLTTTPAAESSKALLEKFSVSDISLASVMKEISYYAVTDGILKNGDDFKIILKDVNNCENAEEIISASVDEFKDYCDNDDVGYSFNIITETSKEQ